MFILSMAAFHTQPVSAKFIVIEVVISLTLVLLWLVIQFTFLAVYFSSYYGPVLGWPVMPNWVVGIGWIWTFGIVVFVVVYYQQIAKSQERRSEVKQGGK